MRGGGPLGDPTGAQEDKKWQKLTKIMNFQNFATIHFTKVKTFCFSFTWIQCRESSTGWKMKMKTPCGPTRGRYEPKMAKIDQNL